MNKTLSEELGWRRFIQQKTFDDPKWLDTPRTVYFGVDPSADSLHVGNLASFMPLRHMIDHGWKVVLLVGGATGMIGDPGGKSEERNLLTPDEIQHNKKAVGKQVKRLFAGKKFHLVDNIDWLSQVNLLEFLRDTGKYFSMTPLVQRDYIAKRIGEEGVSISYTEFSYTLLQGYDYWHLNKHHGVELQYGGSDQWGNMLSGVELIRRKEGKEAHVLAGPLVVDNRTGKKFGKTENGAVWLDAEKTSPYQFYQFWLNADDGAVEEYLGYYTLLSQDEIKKVMNEFNSNRASRVAQKRLAYEVTKLIHGEERAQTVKRVTEVLFGEGNFLELGKKELEIITDEILVVEGLDDFSETLVRAGLATSKTEARNFYASGAISVNGEKVTPESPYTFRRGLNLVKRGKNNFAVVKEK